MTPSRNGKQNKGTFQNKTSKTKNKGTFQKKQGDVPKNKNARRMRGGNARGRSDNARGRSMRGDVPINARGRSN